MLSYLTAENSFIRSYGNRSLLLLLLCAFTRTGESVAKASIIGVSVDINPAVIAAFGPVLGLLITASLKLEADSLITAREAVLGEVGRSKPAFRTSVWLYLLMLVPTGCTAFLALQFLLKLVPDNPGCPEWNWWRQLTDFSRVGGTPSVYCIGDLTKGTPWTYPPIETWLLLACVLGSAYLTYTVIQDWPMYRGR
ncbi:hypothetical protein ABIC09_005852 [Bradyrhizobium sp. S3.12.5]|uniref:hypothetical protein n=1 Tax=Bradyrhizobium sp. S3.12.5 TaxID=3156386 RepID=UPI003394CD9D